MTALQTKAKRAAKRAQQAMNNHSKPDRVGMAVRLANLFTSLREENVVVHRPRFKNKPITVNTVRAKEKRIFHSQPLIHI